MRILDESRIILTPEIMNNRTYRPPLVRPRSPGLHVQELNKRLGIAAGKLDADEDSPFDPFTDRHYPMQPALGVAWEEFRASHYPEDKLMWQPVELERDGIFGTPDGLLIEQTPEIWECKQTTKKIQRIDTCWMYVKQGMSYCAMWGLRRVRYDVCWLMGDYTRPYKADATSTLVEFDERELEQWWERIMATAKSLR